MFRGGSSEDGIERPIRVLHVDDEPDFADLAATFLEREHNSLKVDTATSADAGLAYLDEHEVDCVVSDYDMPERNGIDFLRSIRSTMPELPVILFTGKGSEEVASDAISAGVTDYLQKESGTSQYAILANRIENVVAQRRSRERVDRSEERLRDVIDTLPQFLFVVNEDGKYLIVNEAHARFHGTSPEELEGKHVSDQLGERVQNRLIGDMKTALEEGEPIDPPPVELQDASGEDRLLQPRLRPFPLDDGEELGFLGISEDITDQVAEREELELHRTIIDQANTLIVTIDEAQRILMVNPAVKEMLGYTPEELIGEDIAVLMDTEHARQHRESFERFLQTDRRSVDWRGIELQAKHADGSRVPVSIAFSAATYDDEPVFTGFITDISDRKQKALAAARTDALLSSLFSALPVGVLAEDTERNVLAINDRMTKLFDLPESVQELIGDDCRELLEGATEYLVESDRFFERTNAIIDKNNIVKHEEWELVNGTAISRSHHPIALPEGNGHLWVYHDVSEGVAQRQRLEDLVRVSQDIVAAETAEEAVEIGVEAAKTVLGLSANAIHLYDEETHALVPVVGTEATHELIGELPTLTPGGSIAWEVFEEGRPQAIDDVREHPTMHNPDTPVRSELLFPIGDRGMILAGSTETEAFDHQDLLMGELLAGIIATSLDEIEHTERLKSRERELAQKNERLEAFTNIVSHDLRTPLNVATARHDLAREVRESEHDEQIATAHRHMSQLIDDLLDLAREEHQPVALETVDLEATVTGCWEQTASEEATLEVEVDGSIRADPRHLRRLLENLLNNAIEHGGPDISVTIGTLDQGFFVADDGSGIPPEEQSEIFETGFSTSPDGTGLGLGIVTRVVEEHGWSIELETSAAGGVRWEVTGIEWVR